MLIELIDKLLSVSTTLNCSVFAVRADSVASQLLHIDLKPVELRTTGCDSMSAVASIEVDAVTIGIFDL